MSKFKVTLASALSVLMIAACTPANVNLPDELLPSANPEANNAELTGDIESPFEGSFEQSAEDCESYEVFDEEIKACVLDCDSDEACDRLEAQIDGEFNNLEQGFFENERPASTQFQSAKSVELSDKEHPTLRYSVAKGALGETTQDLKGRSDLPEIFAAASTHNQIWDLYKNISTTTLLNDVFIFDLVYDDSGAGNVALVSPIEQNNKRWLVEANVFELLKANSNSVDLSTLRHTMIHEFAHVLTLHDNQVDGAGSAESCANFYIQEGCSRDKAYIDGFYQNFWTEKFAENERIQNTEDPDAKADEQNAFYEKHKADFVTAYAATNPVEDAAESFTAFVIKKDKPTGSSQADQKVAFFYNFPELVQLRNQIRQRIAFQSGDFQAQFVHSHR